LDKTLRDPSWLTRLSFQAGPQKHFPNQRTETKGYDLEDIIPQMHDYGDPIVAQTKVSSIMQNILAQLSTHVW